jgi:hypothetical protein
LVEEIASEQENGLARLRELAAALAIADVRVEEQQ